MIQSILFTMVALSRALIVIPAQASVKNNAPEDSLVLLHVRKIRISLSGGQFETAWPAM
jgi:hypothetical protein